MKKIAINFFMVSSFVALTATPLMAAGNGSAPKGKPFVAINDQIVEVEGAVSSIQDQIESLVARVDTVEQRVKANEDAVSTLQEQNAALDILIQQNLSDIQSIEAEISTLQQTDDDLAALITANSGDIESLQTEIDSNKALIASLQSAILLIQNNSISLQTSLQSQIDHNMELIGGLQDQINQINAKLDFKQNLINGVCPDGKAIQQILSDGSVICEGVGGVSGQLESVYSYSYSSYVPNGYGVGATAYCPSGYTVTAAGFDYLGTGWDLYALYTGYNSNYYNYGYVAAYNHTGYTDYFLSRATCTRIAP